ncbi:MAG: hypothetical protein HZA29_05080 [Candidatus Omnitrophica bacterium]|nr:hypothetical protein [Candidatus Omnitrophota bacterium]
MENSRIAAGKDLSSRIMELLRCFDNEAFDLNGRKYKLPAFRELAPMKMNNPQQGNSFDVIKASTVDEVWLVTVKDENVGEAEVNTVMEESRKSGQKARRCLFISMKKPDDSTRLRALQEKFWIWSQEEINSLLTLFDKPYIVRSAVEDGRSKTEDTK